MKYLKILGLAAIAAGALMAFVGAGTAPATTLDCSATTMCEAPGAGTRIHATNEGNVTLDAAIKITCETSTVEGRASTGGENQTPNGEINALTFEKCGSWTVTVLRRGSLEVHTDPESAETERNGTLTSKGAEVTVEGFGLHCIYGTSNSTDIGTVTSSKSRGGTTATFDIKAQIERLPGSRSGAFCGGTTAEWTGSYSIDAPDYLDVT